MARRNPHLDPCGIWRSSFDRAIGATITMSGRRRRPRSTNRPTELGDTDWLDCSDRFRAAPNRTFERSLRKYAAASVLGARVRRLPGRVRLCLAAGIWGFLGCTLWARVLTKIVSEVLTGSGAAAGAPPSLTPAPRGTGPGGAGLCRRHPQPAVGGRHHLRGHLVGLRLRGLCDRRVLPHDRGLAGRSQPASRPGPRRLGDGHLVPHRRRVLPAA